jgi:hypothetical protein
LKDEYAGVSKKYRFLVEYFRKGVLINFGDIGEDIGIVRGL